MLVISRKLNESIEIDCGNGDIIEIVVVALRNNHVRLGLDAPSKFRILRSELNNRTGEQQRRPVVADRSAIPVVADRSAIPVVADSNDKPLARQLVPVKQQRQAAKSATESSTRKDD
jgi:carbon storage regulator CsrA